jgi:hypothetical protein
MRLFLAGLASFLFFQYSSSQQSNSKNNYLTTEVVNYSLKYGFFKIGEAHVEFNFNQICSGAFIQANAKSTGLVRFIKDIYYKYECCIDTLTGLPMRDSRILIEGDYIDTSTVYYDRSSRQDSSLIYSKKTGTIVGPKGIYDLLSGFYYYRSDYLRDSLPLNHKFSTKTFFIDKIWDLKIIYFGKETINTKYGPIECLKVKPVTIIGHFFRTSDAMTVWFTNNEKHIPVKFSIDFKLGTLTGYITDYKSHSK